MSLKINHALTARNLLPKLTRVFELSAQKIEALRRTWDPGQGTPVFTVGGKYTSRGWTEWTQGFQFGSTLLQFDATGDEKFLDLGRRNTVHHMASHVSHIGVHDHGFNNISTYGNLWRLMRDGKIPANEQEQNFYELALKVSGAVQAARWTDIGGGAGYIYSFNGPHSLFVDTLRSLRSLAVAHQLGHVLMGERDRRINLLQRLIAHAVTTARYNVFYGASRDAYDVRGRIAHECIFNVRDGSFRCPNSQQGYSPFTTWTRGLAWAILGFAEELEFLLAVPEKQIRAALSLFEEDPGERGKEEVPMPHSPLQLREVFVRAASATADFFIANTCRDGIPMWDTGAPNLHQLGSYLDERADPYNAWEPVDSSAAVIAAQGLVRLGGYLQRQGQAGEAKRYQQAGLTIASALFDEPYLSTRPKHQGLLLHSVYHRPNGWDFVARGQKVPNGESSMWGDYHARELALLLLRKAQGLPPLLFFRPAGE
jgi:unsaturated chondroitin disaccharide hydrolase